MRAQLGFCPKVTRHEPLDGRSARFFVFRVTPALRKIGEICLASSGGYSRQHGPWPSGMGSRNGPSSHFKEEDDLNSEDAEVHSGGTDVVSYSSTQLVYAVYGFVELFLDSFSAQWTSRSICSPLTPLGVEGRWQWSSIVGTAQHAQPAALTAFFDRSLPQFLPFRWHFSASEHEMKEQSSQTRPDHRNVCEKIEGQRWEKGGSQRDPVVFQVSPRQGVRPTYAERTTGTPPEGRSVHSSVSPRVGFSRWSSTLRPLLPPSGL